MSRYVYSSRLNHVEKISKIAVIETHSRYHGALLKNLFTRSANFVEISIENLFKAVKIL